MKTITDAEKEEIYNLTFERFKSHKVWGAEFEDMPDFGRCIPWTVCGIEILRERGFNPVIQAGSLQWPMVSPENDDGVRMTHLAYMWTPDEPLSQLALAHGRLPEMHVWIGLPDRVEFVDFSTGALRKWADASGLEWTAPDPPKFFWSNQLLPGVRYVTSRQAISCALAFIANIERHWAGPPESITSEDIYQFARRFGITMLPGSDPETKQN
jgi:hypothetical protein